MFIKALAALLAASISLIGLGAFADGGRKASVTHPPSTATIVP